MTTNHTLIRAIAGACLLWASTSLQAFQVFELEKFGVTFQAAPVHESVTLDALATISYQEVGFDLEAKYQIVREVRWTDSEFMGVNRVHFDAEEFTAGQARLNSGRLAVGYFARAGEGAHARRVLGQLLHSVQDFYAHSTWVERGFNHLAQLGRGELGFTSNPSATTCVALGLFAGAPLTSGFAGVLNPTAGDSDYIYDNESAVWKCGHGRSYTPFVGQIGNTDFLGAGINKDGPAREGYSQARELAVRASRQFVNDIVQDLIDEPEAICNLFGQAVELCQGQVQVAVYQVPWWLPGTAGTVPLVITGDIVQTFTRFDTNVTNTSTSSFGSTTPNDNYAPQSVRVGGPYIYVCSMRTEETFQWVVKSWLLTGLSLGTPYSYAATMQDNGSLVEQYFRETLEESPGNSRRLTDRSSATFTYNETGLLIRSAKSAQRSLNRVITNSIGFGTEVGSASGSVLRDFPGLPGLVHIRTVTVEEDAIPAECY